MDNKIGWLLIPFSVFLFWVLNQTEANPVSPKGMIRPHTGRTHAKQSDEAYCLECIEGHSMMGSTEMRHAIDRYRTAKEMTPGVTEKVRVAIGELQGIVEDAKNTEGATPEVKQGINEILDEVRWIRKEYGLSGKGLTTGHGTEEDLKELKTRIENIQDKAYELVEKCPNCRIRY